VLWLLRLFPVGFDWFVCLMIGVLFDCLLCCCLFVLGSMFGLVLFSGVDAGLMIDLVLDVCGYVIVLLSLFVCFYM